MQSMAIPTTPSNPADDDARRRSSLAATDVVGELRVGARARKMTGGREAWNRGAALPRSGHGGESEGL